MTSRSFRFAPLARTTLAAAAVLAACVSLRVDAAMPTPSKDITPAERLLFLEPHMKGVAPQTELDYAFDLSGPPAKVSDTVRVFVTTRDDAKHDASVTDRSGKVPVPVEGMPCNPVIVYFLEHDVTEMQQLTGGQHRYFQKRIRLALASNPKMKPVVVKVDGKSVNAREIVIEPYTDDPNASRFPQYTGKRYTFVIADDTVPGRVVQIRTEVPGKGGDFSHPIQKEALVYRSAAHRMAPPASGTPPALPPPAATQSTSR